MDGGTVFAISIGLEFMCLGIGILLYRVVG